MVERAWAGALLTNFHADLGGGEFSLLAHTGYLRSRGEETHVLLFNEGPIVERLRAQGCEVTVLRCRLDCGPRGATSRRFAWFPG